MPAMEDIAGDLWNDDLKKMFVSLGTAVYVMDAVDDLDEDYMNDTYNPFLTECDDYVNKTEFIRKNVYMISNLMNGVMKDLQSSYLSVRETMRFHHGVTDNIVMHGLPGSAKRVIACECAARPSIRNSISSRILRKNE
jgi:2-phosphoglycerate kinase